MTAAETQLPPCPRLLHNVLNPSSIITYNWQWIGRWRVYMYVACGKKGDNNNIISKVWPLFQAILSPSCFVIVLAKSECHKQQ